MKHKILLITVMLPFAITSCKKKYTCSCTIDTIVYASNGSSNTITTKTDNIAYSKKMTNSQARSACIHEQETIRSTEENLFTANHSQSSTTRVSAHCALQ